MGMIKMIDDLITSKTEVTRLFGFYKNLDSIKEILKTDFEIASQWENWYKVDGVWYFYKPYRTKNQFFNELIGSELAKHFSLDAVEYKIASKEFSYSDISDIDEECRTIYGIMSENFKDKSLRYYDSKVMKYECNQNHHIALEILNILKSSCSEELARDVVKLTVLDFYMQQQDRRANMLFTIDKDEYVRLCKIFDFERSFQKTEPSYRNSILRMNLDDYNTLQILRHDDMFQEEFNRLMEIDMNAIIKNVKNKYHLALAKDFLETYYSHDKTMKKMVKEYKII